MSYREAKKLESEVICSLKELEFIIDPEDITNHLQELLKKLTELIRMNPGERNRYENMRRLLTRSDSRFLGSERVRIDFVLVVGEK